jgi:hypothetical protein
MDVQDLTTYHNRLLLVSTGEAALAALKDHRYGMVVTTLCGGDRGRGDHAQPVHMQRGSAKVS